MANWLDRYRQERDYWFPTRLLNSRRWTVSMFAILCLTIIGLTNNTNTAIEIAGVAAALASANAYQRKSQPPAKEGVNHGDS